MKRLFAIALAAFVGFAMFPTDSLASEVTSDEMTVQTDVQEGTESDDVFLHETDNQDISAEEDVLSNDSDEIAVEPNIDEAVIVDDNTADNEDTLQTSQEEQIPEKRCL